MSEPGLSKRARKKQARETQPQASRSESVTSDAAKRDDPTTLAQAALDPDYKPKEGANPFIDVVQKKVRNLTKRRTRLEALDAQNKDPSMPALKPDQVEALSHLPVVIGIITELSELLQMFKKLEQSETQFLASQYRKYKDDLREAEREKVIAVNEAYAKGQTEARGETKLLTSFLKYASHRRANPSHIEGENQAAEALLLDVYQGGESGALVAQKLAEGVEEPVSEDESFTYARVKDAVLKFEDPSEEVAESPSEQLNGSYLHVERDAEQGSNGVAGYQIPLSETSPLDNGHYIHDSSVAPVGVNFFQTSELENETYPTTSQGLPTTGISFLQESELGTSQPHEDYTVDERAEQIDDLQPSPQMPPQQSLTDTPEPPKVNLGASAYLAIETGDAGNAASEKMLSKPTSQVWSTVETKTDWAEEASPTTETAPVLAEKNQNEEWTTQASKHSRHQSQQQRGRGTGQRGRGAYRGEARGGTRGAYRGRGGDRGASNGERRGSYRGGERGRGRGASNPPPTAV